MKILVTPTSARATKKLHATQKAELDSAVLAISTEPEIGESRVGDLLGVCVYKFRLSNLLCLLAYRVLDADCLKLLTFGSHENFYRDLKKLDN